MTFDAARWQQPGALDMPLAEITNPHNLQFRVNDDKCTTCLFHPGNMAKATAFIDDARERGSYTVCHETYAHRVEGSEPYEPPADTQRAMCRGYYDAYARTQRGLAELVDIDAFEFVPTPPPPADQRRYEVLRVLPDRVVLRRVHEGNTVPDNNIMRVTVYMGEEGRLEVHDDDTELDVSDYDAPQDALTEWFGEFLGEQVRDLDRTRTTVIEVQGDHWGQKMRLRATLEEIEPVG